MMLYARREFGTLRTYDAALRHSDDSLFTPLFTGIGTTRSAALLTIFGLVSALSQSVGLACARRAGYSEPVIVRFCFGCALVGLCMWGFARA